MISLIGIVLTGETGVLAGPSETAQAHYEAGLAAKQAKDYDQAVAELKQAIELAPDYADARFALAWVWIAKEEKDKAIAEFKEVLRLAPESKQGEEAKAALERMGVRTGSNLWRVTTPEQPELGVELRCFSFPALSSDGRKAAFVVGERKARDQEWMLGQMAVVSTDGKPRMLLAPIGAVRDAGMAFSPRDDAIAYEGGRVGVVVLGRKGGPVVPQRRSLPPPDPRAVEHYNAGVKL